MSNDGGPAFPGERLNVSKMPGMSLRDYFATAALPTAYKEYLRDGGGQEGAYWLVVAEDAYSLADAMLEARKESENVGP